MLRAPHESHARRAVPQDGAALRRFRGIPRVAHLQFRSAAERDRKVIFAVAQGRAHLALFASSVILRGSDGFNLDQHPGQASECRDE